MEKRLQEIKVALEKFQARKAEIDTELRSNKADIDLNALDKEVDTINAEVKPLLEEQRSIENKLEIAKKINEGSHQFRTLPKPTDKKEDIVVEDKFATLEYRNAFMAHVLSGTPIPQEYRADATTVTGDIGAVIPAPIMQKIIEDQKFYGNIYKRVTHTNFQGGLSIPLGNLRPVATWTAEGSVSDKQKKEAKLKVSFLYYKLQCRVAISLIASVTSLAVFEAALQESVSEAMIVALEAAIINGTGIDQPLGITKDTRILAGKKITIKPSEIGTWDKWAKVFAKVPMKKRNGLSLILNYETFEGDIQGMVDTAGQPIARTTYGIDGSESYRFKGKEVLPVEETLPTFEAAATDAVFGIICNLKDYVINSNLQMGMRKYFDENTDEYITKATVIADGKLADVQGVILLTKGVDA